MYIVTIKYRNGTEKVLKISEYSEACAAVNKYADTAESVHLKEVKE